MSGVKGTGAGVAGVTGAGVLPFTGIAFTVYVAIALALVIAGVSLRLVARARG